ncbi:chaperonin 10-like protein [Phascolomyces articulosus]|uniref:Chaperonin 10-like protein n=1 Tax=Phascolomyces articulosus TaxID=60185 RepID=A0AAD5KAN6_9FUNG|nr:chaperonin 10-like protein [Phascolomyces articulosus]
MNAAANFAQDKLGAHPTSASNQDTQNTDPNLKMLACVWLGKEKLEVQELDAPAITDPEDAIVKVTGTSVCGSDLHLYHGDVVQLKKGDILGHEMIGIVEKVGKHVINVKPGDRVVASFNVACGKCNYCKRQLYTSCDTTNDSNLQQRLYGMRNAGSLGNSHFSGGFAGGQAEYSRIPFSNTNLLKVPDSIPDEKALYLGDMIPTSYHAVWDTGCQENEIIGVFGLGPIGLSVVQWLRNVFKAARIIVVDNVPERLHLAQIHWDAEPINFKEDQDIIKRIFDLVPEGLDRAIDCAGFRYTKSLLHKIEHAVGLETDSPEVLNECLRAVKKFGTVGIIADYTAYTNHFLVGALMEKGIRLIGCGQAPIQRHWGACLEYVEKGLFDPTTILTNRYPLEKTPQIYKLFDEKDAGVIKVFIETKFSNKPTVGTPALDDPDE